MKKILTLVLASLLCAGYAFAGATPGSGVTDSKHDLSGYVAGEERVCAFCHTPHHADTKTYDYMPLWSHQLTSQSSFTEYDSTTFDGIVVDPMEGPSILCMSCHDGVVAPDAYYGKTGSMSAGSDTYGSFAVGLGGDMSNDHPIGFSYGDAQADDQTGQALSNVSEIRPKDEDLTTDADLAAEIGHVGKVENLLYDPFNIGDGDIMTCASCHDVHNGSKALGPAFTYATDIDSAFCRMCHLK